MRASLALLLLPFAAMESQATGEPAPSPVTIMEHADSLYFAGHVDELLTMLDGAIAHDSANAALQWRAARATIAAGMLRPRGEDRRGFYDRALVYARAAHTLAPKDLDARYWLAAAAGRRADKNDPVYSARLALEVYDQATAILAEDSSHAGAHHALGMLHAEATRLPRIVRFLAARALRVDFAAHASVSEATRHLQRAVDLDPGMIQYMADLTDLLVRTGRSAEAAVLLQRLAKMPVRHPADGVLRDACVTKWQPRVTGTVS